MSRRKLSFGLIAALILMVAVIFTIRYLSTGQLVVNSEPGADIYLVSEADPEPRQIGTGTATSRLAPGNYVVHAREGERETRSSVVVTARATTESSLALQQLRQPELIYSANASDLVINDGKIRFLSTFANTIYEVGASEYLTKPFDLLVPIARTFWTGFASAVLLTDNDTLLLLNNGKTGTLLPPDGIDLFINVREEAISVNEAGQAAILVADKIIFYENVTDQPQTIQPDTPPFLADQIKLSSNRLAAYYNQPVPLTDLDADSDFKQDPVRLVISDLRTGNTMLEQSFSDEEFITDAWWSPNGKSLAYTTNFNSYVVNPETKENTPLLQPLFGLIQNLVWLNDNRFLFSYENNLWLFDLESQQASKFSASRGELSKPNAAVIDEQVLYYSTTSGRGITDGDIYRIDLSDLLNQ